METNELDSLVQETFGAPKDDPIDSEVQAMQNETRVSLKTAGLAVEDKDPDRTAEVFKLSESMKLPRQFVESNYDVLAKKNKGKVFDYDKIVDENPQLAQWSSDPDNLALVKDDADNVLKTAESVKEFGLINSMYQAVGQGSARTLSGMAKTPGFLVETYYNAFVNPMAEAMGYAPVKVSPEIRDNPIAKYYDQNAEALSANIPELSESFFETANRGDFAKAGRILAVQLAANAPQQALIIAGGLSGAGIATSVGVGLTSGAQTYDENVDKGMNPASASLNAVVQGTAESVFERLGTLAVVKRLEASVASRVGKDSWSRIWKDAVKYLGGAGLQEGTEELATSGMQSLSDKMTGANPDLTLRQAAVGAIDSFVIGAGSGMAMTSPAAMASGVMRRHEMNQQQAVLDFHTALGQASLDSKLRKRLPQKHQEMLEKLTKDGPVENVYIPVESIKTYFQSKNLDPLEAATLYGIQKEFLEAQESGSDLRIPIGKFTTNLVETEHYQGLARDIKYSPDAETANEYDERQKLLEAEIKLVETEAVEEAQVEDGSPTEGAIVGEPITAQEAAVMPAAPAQEGQAVETAQPVAEKPKKKKAEPTPDMIRVQSGKQVKSIIKERLTALNHPKIGTHESEQYALLHMKMMMQLSSHTPSALPMDILNKYGFAIKLDDGEVVSIPGTAFASQGQVLKQEQQSPTDTPEFKEWFGDSKVVDETGKPLVVYHGTGRDFESFQKKQENDRGYWGEGFYFSPSQADGSFYADLYSQRSAGTDNQPGPNVMPVYLSLRNPLVVYKDQFINNPNDPKAFSDNAKAKGHDGIIVKSRDKDDSGQVLSEWIQEIVAFEPTQIKSAIGNRGTFDPQDPRILFQSSAAQAVADVYPPNMVSPLGFISPLQNAVAQMDFKEMPAKDLANRIKNLPGIKTEELELTGVLDFLATREGKVSKAEVEQYIKENSLSVNQVVLSGDFEGSSASEDGAVETEWGEPERDHSYDSDDINSEMEYFGSEDYWDEERVAELRAELVADYTDENGEIDEDGLSSAVESAKETKAEELATESVESDEYPSARFTVTDEATGWTLDGSDELGWYNSETGEHFETDLEEAKVRLIGHMIRKGALRGSTADFIKPKDVKWERTTTAETPNASVVTRKANALLKAERERFIAAAREANEFMKDSENYEQEVKDDALRAAKDEVIKSYEDPTNKKNKVSVDVDHDLINATLLGNDVDGYSFIIYGESVGRNRRSGEPVARPILHETKFEGVNLEAAKEAALQFLLERRIITPEGDGATLDQQNTPVGRTKFGRYVEPGGENYREILLTIPNEGQEKFYYRNHFDQPNILVHIRVTDRVDDKGRKVLVADEIQSDWHQQGREKGYKGSSKLSDEERSAEIQKAIDERERAYEAKNILVDERRTWRSDKLAAARAAVPKPKLEDFKSKESKEDREGRKFIKYSDLGTTRNSIEIWVFEDNGDIEVRNHRYNAGNFVKGYESEALEIAGKLLSESLNFDSLTSVLSPEDAQIEKEKDKAIDALDAEEKAAAGRLAELKEEDAVPDAPFKNTEAWAGLALKRLIRMGIEQGYDAVAWMPAQTHIDRWGTDNITWAKGEDGAFLVGSVEQQGGVADGTNIEELARIRGELLERRGEKVASKEDLRKVIADTLGRERKDRSLESLTETVWKEMQEKPTGAKNPRAEGMQFFYDKVVPKTAQAIIKKLDPTAKIEVVRFDTGKSPLYSIKNNDSGGYAILGPDGQYTQPANDTHNAISAEVARLNKENPSGIQALEIPITDAMKAKSEQGISLFQSPQPASPTFSKLISTVEQKMGGSANPQEIRAMLKEVKEEEKKWLGLEEFLAGKEKVKRQDLLDFLRANEPEIVDVTNGKKSPEQMAEFSALESRLGEVNTEWNELSDYVNEQRREIIRYLVQNAQEEYFETFKAQSNNIADGLVGDGFNLKSSESAVEQLLEMAPGLSKETALQYITNKTDARKLEIEREDIRAKLREFGGDSDTKYQQYTLPGGENYREVLFTLPPSDSTAISDAKRKLADADKRAEEYADKFAKANKAERVELAKQGDALDREIAELNKTINQESKLIDSQSYKSSHYPDLNILAHTRLTDRTDADGKRVLFIEEIQSDWHQEGRKKGYKGDSKINAELKTLAESYDIVWEERRDLVRSLMLGTFPEDAKSDLSFDSFSEVQKDETLTTYTIKNYVEGDSLKVTFQPDAKAQYRLYIGGVLNQPFKDRAQLDKYLSGFGAVVTQLNAVNEERQKLISQYGEIALRENVDIKIGDFTRDGGSPRGQVPDAPFKKTWHEYAMKRIVRMAAEGGYDRIAWTTGEQQAERFDISKTIDSITYTKKDGKVKVTPSIKGNGGTSSRYIVETSDGDYGPVEEMFGKDIAEKIKNDQAEMYEGNDYREGYIKNADLKVGGEGMKGFYDKILVDYAKKFGKKFGATVGEASIPDASKVDAKKNPITPEVRAAIEEVDNLGFDSVGQAAKAIIDDANWMETFDAKDADSVIEDWRRAAKDSTATKVHSLDVTDKMKEVALGQGFELFQPNSADDGPRGAITIGPQKQMDIKLFAKADLSTFLHETGHFYLEIIDDLAKDPRTSQRLKDDYGKIRTWLGAKPGETLTVDQHEQWARGFELYLAKGQAPSEDLKRAFANFKVWLTRIYENLLDLRVELTPEITGVMDRLLASDQEIAMALRDQRPLFENPLQAGMSEAQSEEYKKLDNDAKREANEKITQEAVQYEMQKRQAAYKAARKEVKERVEKEAGEIRVYRALSILQKGKMPDGSPLPEGTQKIKIDRDSIIALKGKEFLKTLPRPYFYSKDDGVPVEMVAEMFGFPSATEMLEAFSGMPKLDEYVEREVDREMALRFPDEIMEKFPEEAVKAAHSDSRGKVIRFELETLAKNNLPLLKDAIRRVARRVPTEAEVRGYARQLIAKKPMAEIRPDAFARAERKAAREAGVKLAQGDIYGAFEAKRKELLNYELFRAATEARETYEKAEEFFKKYKGKDEDIAKTRDTDIVNVGRAILAAHGIGRTEKTPEQYLEKMKLYAPEDYDSAVALINNSGLVPGPYKEISFDDFSNMYETVRALWALAKNSRSVEIDGVRMDRDQIIDELAMRVDEVSKPGQRLGYDKAVTDWEKTKMKLLGARASLRRVESWVSAIDDGNGVFRKYIWNPIVESTARYRTAKVEVLTKYQDLLKNWAKASDVSQAPIKAENLGYTFAGKVELMGAILHTGNKSNLEKLLIGRGWGTRLEDGTLDTNRWDAFMVKMYRDGVITKADMDFAQSVWDLMETLKPGAQKAHKAMYGFYFNEVTADTIDTPFGSYRGGYVPAITDSVMVEDNAINQEKESLKQNNASMYPTAGRGFTKSRVEQYAAPLAMDLRLVGSHIDKVLRFIHIEPSVKEVARVVMNKGFRAKLAELDPVIGQDMLVPWLQRAAQQTVSTPSKGWAGKAIDTFAKEMRKRSGLQAMFFNITNTMQQVTGFTIAAVRVKPKYLRNAMYRYLKSPKEMAEAVTSRSEFMKTRSDSQVMEVNKIIDELALQPNKFQEYRDFVQQHGYFMQSAAQGFVDHVVWSGAYEEAIANGQTEKEAGRIADSAVRETQGSMNPEDMSRFESGSPLVRMFTMFYSYFNMQANLMGTEFVKTTRDMGLRKGAGRMLYVYTMGFMLPAWISTLIVQAMGNGIDEDDDDQYLDDLLGSFFTSQFSTATAMFPIVGPIVNRVALSFNSKPFDDRITLSPAISMIESAGGAPQSVYKAIADNGSKKKAVRDVMSAIGLLSGIPTGPVQRPLSYLVDVSEGDAEPEGPIDFTRGLVTGKPGQVQ